MIMPRLRNHRKAFTFLFLTIVSIFLLFRHPHIHSIKETLSTIPATKKPLEYLLTDADISAANALSARNATLGVGASWRTRGLDQAAQLSSIEIEITNPNRPDVDTINKFLDLGAEKATKPDKGSTLAWLGHLAVLQKIVSSGYPSTLILEDDVDWDVEIKQQMDKLSSAVRHFTQSTQSTFSFPYGPTNSWDVLWPGHCGELWNRLKPSLQYPDETRIPQARYNTRTADSFVAFIRENHRLIQWASGPTCTFAYAVTLTGARKILDLAKKGRSSAFDTELSDLCVFGQLRCLTVNPQLFVHFVPEAAEGEFVSEVERETKGGEQNKDDEDGKSHPPMTGWTQDIVNSARCKAIYGRTCLPEPSREGKDAPAMLFEIRE